MTTKAKIEMTTEERAEWDAWIAERPPVIQAMARRWPGDRLYRNTQTGQVMAIQAYDEGGTVRAAVLPECNGPITGGFSVFGIDPEVLVPATQEYVDARKAEFEPINEAVTAVFEELEPN